MSKIIGDLDNNRGLNIAHLNIRSLWNKNDLFKNAFENSNIQILGISETCLTTALPSDLINLAGYTIFRQDRKYYIPGTTQVKKGVGICLYVRDNIHGNICQLDNLNACNVNIECQWIIIKSDFQRNIIICNAYRPPQGSVKTFIDYLENCLEVIDYVHTDVIIMGDITLIY